MTAKKGIDALFSTTPVHQPTVTPEETKRFEKGTFYFNPEDLAQLERVWLQLMGKGIKCNKSEIVSILVSAGLTEYESDPSTSVLTRRLSGQRRRS